VPGKLLSIDIHVGISAGPWRTVAVNPAAEAGVRTLDAGASGAPVKDLPLLNPLFSRAGGARADRVPPGDLTAVRGRMAELEKAVDVSLIVRTYSVYNGKQIQLDRVTEEGSRITRDRVDLEARLAALTKDLEAGRTPAEVEREINHTGRYIQARGDVDRVDIEIEQFTRKFGPSHDKVVGLKQLRASLQAKVGEIREELRSNYSETLRNTLRNDLAATAANLKRVNALAAKAQAELERQGKLLEEYRALNTLEADMPRKPSGASFTKGFETDGNTVVSVAHALTDHEVRVVAVGENGQEVAAASSDTRSTDGVGHTTATFAKLTPEQIKAFRLQARPFEWVEFRKVSLAPTAKAQGEKQKAGEARRQGHGRTGVEEEPLTPEEWARVDEEMAHLLRIRSEQEARSASLETQLGERHPTIIRMKQHRELLDKAIAERARQVSGGKQLTTKPAGSP
jgi:hypothetical protein